MYKLILILLFAYCFAVDTENEIRTGQHTLKNLYVNRGELELESDINIHGIQFDIIYNPREIKSITPLQIRGYEVLFNAISDSLIRSLIYSLEGKNLPEIINYDFVKADGFNGVSTVQFVDISAADSNGQSIEFPKVKSYDIDFRGYTLLERKSLNNIELSRDDIYDDSWAVIIGIDKYKYSDQLNYAVKDAEAVKDMLISKFDYPEENIRYLTNEDATLSNIKLNLGEVATSAGREDRILIFYSGHGETSVGADKSETGYIVPYEGKIDNLYATGLAMDDILRTCQLSKSKHMLFLMDACYSGLMTENVKSLSTPSEEGYLNKVANEKARQIITAGGRDEQVIERDEWQHSAFTKNLLAGLDDWESDTDNDGYVTADELGSYLRKSVTEDSDNMQTPQKGRFRNSGGGEFVFFSNHNTINQNVQDISDNAKLDYLISEVEELKSQQSSDDIVVKKDVDEKQSRHIKIQKTQGIGFMAFEDLLQIGYTRALNGNWYYLMSYANIQGKLFKKLINVESSHTITGNNHSIGLVRYYVLTDYQNNDFMWLLIGGVANYLTVSWKDTERNISGDVNKIFPSLTAGIGLRPFWINKYSIGAGVTLSIATSLLPKSYSETDGIITLSGWQIKLFPALLLNIDFPLPK